ncbi:MAG: SRPBCC family protein [Saprospiraceae bacterium]|nr:SRPBCC family protein [Saprospiraceae bacterium]
MQTLLNIVLVILGLVALVLIVAAFAPKKYSISRNIVIYKSQAQVFDYIKHLKNQDQYNKWVMADPNMEKKYSGTDGTVGFIYAWDGNKKAGKGEEEIKAIVPNEKLDVEIRFIKPFEAIAQTPFRLESLSDQQTRVTWGMSSAMKYPMNIMLLFMNIEKMLGGDMEISLGNLKKILESK